MRFALGSLHAVSLTVPLLLVSMPLAAAPADTAAARPQAPAPRTVTATPKAAPATSKTTPAGSATKARSGPAVTTPPTTTTASNAQLDKLAAGLRDSSAAVKAGRKLLGPLQRGEAKTLWEQFDPALRSSLGNLGKFERTLQQIAEQHGALRHALRDDGRTEDGRPLYEAYLLYDKAAAPLVLRAALTATGQIASFSLRDEAREHDSRHARYEPKTELRLPVRGEWTVTAGGRTLAQNPNAVSGEERFAYEFQLAKDGKAYVNDGAMNDAYYSFGQPVVAPARGKVVFAADGQQDNNPGRPNLDKPAGNTIVLDHGNGEYSVLSRLRCWGIFVRVGQEVAQGDTIAFCGNSGASGAPHVHYSLQNGPLPLGAESLPARFVDYEVDGRAVERGEPLRGERVRRAEGATAQQR